MKGAALKDPPVQSSGVNGQARSPRHCSEFTSPHSGNDRQCMHADGRWCSRVAGGSGAPVLPVVAEGAAW